MMQPVGMKKAQDLVKKYFDQAKAKGPERGDEVLTMRIIQLADDNEPFFNSGDLSKQDYDDMFDRIFVAVQEVE